MNTARNIFFIALILLFIPTATHAAPLCSDGTPAPAGNICNCAAAFNGGGSNFTPGSGSSLTGNTFDGKTFSGLGGALISCLNIGGAISNLSSNLQNGDGFSFKDNSVQQIPVNASSVEQGTTKTAKETAATTKREQCLNGAAYAAAKTSLQKLSDKTLNWVKTGYNGNPLYVRDIDSFMSSIAGEKLNTYLNQYIDASNSPVFGNALKSVIKKQVTGWDDGYLNKAMNTPEGKAYTAFQSDFTQGGWGALLNMKNNPIGAYFNATDQVSGIIGTAQQNTQNELQQGNGFLSMRKCVEYEDKSTKVSGTNSSGPDCGTLQDQAQEQYDTCMQLAGSGQTQQEQSASEQICQITLTAAQSQITSSTCSPANGTTPVLAGSKAKCLKYETVTPGSLIANQVNGVSNSTSQILINADKINETIGVFFGQLMDRLFTDGLSGTGNGSSGNKADPSWSLGNNVVTGTNGKTLASASSCQTPLGYDPSTGGFDQEFDISRPQQLNSVIVTQKNFLTRMQDAQFVMNKFIPRLGALDYCIPGPNPTYNNNLNENAQALISQFQTLTETYNNAANTAIQGALDPGHILTAAGCAIFPRSCDNTPHIVGYSTTRVSLFDKVTEEQKRISDRIYGTGASEELMRFFLSDVVVELKSLFATTYTDTNIINAFVSTSTNPAQQTLISGKIKESIKITADLPGYAQGIAGYNEYYSSTIENTQAALTELAAIYKDVQDIVGPAKARYILDMQNAGTPVNLSCIDNAYRLGPIGTGVAHLENITAPLDAFQLHSAASSAYFYSHL